MFSLWFVCVRIWSKVVNTVSVPTSIYIYRTDMYTSIEMSIFHIDLNTGRFRALLVPVGTEIFFFLVL